MLTKLFGKKKQKCSITISEMYVSHFKKVANQTGSNFSAVVDAILAKEFDQTEAKGEFIQGQTEKIIELLYNQELLIAQAEKNMLEIRKKCSTEQKEELFNYLLRNFNITDDETDDIVDRKQILHPFEKRKEKEVAHDASN